MNYNQLAYLLIKHPTSASHCQGFLLADLCQALLNQRNIISDKNKIKKSIKFVFILLFLFSSTFLFAQDNLTNKYRLGKSYAQMGELEKAKHVFEEISNIQPTNNQFTNSLNEIYLKLKEYDKSISFLQNRIKIRPNDVSLYGMLGASYYLNNNYKKAIEVWDNGIKVNNNSIINYSIISNTAIQYRAFDIAIKYLEEGKKKSHNPELFSYQLAQIYAHTMAYKKAASEYIDVLLDQPSQLNYIKRRMEVYLSAVGAIEGTIIAVKEKSNNNSVKELLSFLYVKNNEYEKAFELEKELDELKTNDGLRIYNFANNAFHSAKFDVASQAYNYLIDNYSNSRFIPNCKLGFARTLEAKLNKEWNAKQHNWKPISTIDTTGSSRFYTIIKTYESISSIVNGELSNEILFRIGKIYLNKFNNLKMAIKYFQQIIINSSLSTYYGKANLGIAKILILQNKLEDAKINLQNVFSSSQTEMNTKRKAKFVMAQVEFYESNFNKSISIIKNINKDLSNDLSNDAIQLAMIINIGKRDSVNLVKFANAELFITQHNFIQAEKYFKELSENKNLFVINNISRLKYAEILIAQNKYPVAIEVLKELSETKEMNIFADESFYLLAQVYEFGVVDKKSAILTYEKFLELFPNSLLLEKVQKNLKQIKNNRSKNL